MVNPGIFGSHEPAGAPAGYWVLRRDIFESSSGYQYYNWNRPPGVREILVTVQAAGYSNLVSTCYGSYYDYYPGQARTARIINPPARVAVTVGANNNQTSSFGDMVSAYGTGGSVSPSVIQIMKTQTANNNSPDVNGLDAFRSAQNNYISSRITVEYLQWVTP